MKNHFSRWCSRLWQSSIVFGMGATALRVGVQLMLLPAVLLYLSPADQAMWWVFVALGNAANLADCGFGPAITRVYNYLWAGAHDFDAEGLRPLSGKSEPNLASISILHHTVQHLYRRLCFAAMLILSVVGTLYLFKTVSETKHTNIIWLWWAFYLVAIAVNFGTGYWMMACQGVDRVRQVQIAYILSSLVFLGVAFSMLRLGFGLAGMVAGTLARGLVIWIMGRSAFYKVVPRSMSGKPDFKILRRLWPNARKFGILSLTGYWTANGLVLMSGLFFSAEITASVGITNTAGNLLLNFAALWLQVKWPQITFLRTQGRLQEMSTLFAQRFGLALITFLTFAAFIAGTGNLLLEWKHSSTRLIPLPYLLVYLFYLLQQLVYVQFAMLVFTENVVPFCKLSLLTGLMMVIFSLILTPALGLWGLLISPLIAETFFSAGVIVRRGFVSQSMRLKEFFRATLPIGFRR